MADIEPVRTREQLRRTFACFPSGVTAVCAVVGGSPVGMAASSFTSVSVSPALVSFCVQDTSRTWPVLRGRPRIGLSVLAEGQDDACRRLSAREGDRFAGTPWAGSPDGSAFIIGATAWLDCSLHAEVPAGDHSIALLTVHGLRADPAVPPLVFHGSRFRRLRSA
jgi:flavin reductase (DIM6/NTAB) family NADH-FMN oxidoreductase RutF